MLFFDEVSSMRTEGNLFGRIVSWENLLAAAHRALLGKRYRPPGAAFAFRLEENLASLRRELVTETWTPGAFRQFRIRDPKPRIISAAPFRDRVVHHAVCAIIEPIFERGFIPDSYACRVGKGTHRAILRAQQYMRRYRFLLKCDIRKYFASVDHEILVDRLARRVRCRPTMRLLSRIVHGSGRQEPVHEYFPGDTLFTPYERCRGLPIGNLTSQFFANVHLDGLDHFVKEELRMRQEEGRVTPERRRASEEAMSAHAGFATPTGRGRRSHDQRSYPRASRD